MYMSQHAGKWFNVAKGDELNLRLVCGDIFG